MSDRRVSSAVECVVLRGRSEEGKEERWRRDPGDHPGRPAAHRAEEGPQRSGTAKELRETHDHLQIAEVRHAERQEKVLQILQVLQILTPGFKVLYVSNWFHSSNTQITCQRESSSSLKLKQGSYHSSAFPVDTNINIYIFRYRKPAKVKIIFDFSGKVSLPDSLIKVNKVKNLQFFF